jgi:hypothetical protein
MKHKRATTKGHEAGETRQRAKRSEENIREEKKI